MTSAGSQRRLAAMLGITHQKLGRWLREGEPGGVKAIPAEARGAIAQVFSIHRDIAKQQARVDGIPFDSNVPVLLQRPNIQLNGKRVPGDRAIALNTEFIRDVDRSYFIRSMRATNAFHNVSVRSTIDWFVYMQDKEIERARDRAYAPRQMQLLQDGSIRVKRRTADGRIKSTIIAADVRPVYTQRQSMLKGTRGVDIVDSIEKIMRERHSPAATRMADEYLFQLKPPGFDHDKPRKIPPPKQAKKKRASASRERLKRR